jgi:hypothetical protein
MTFAMGHGECFSCKKIFSFNPKRVPSYPMNGVREPVCRECMDLANANRAAKGMDAHPIHSDAYDPIDADEL